MNTGLKEGESYLHDKDTETERRLSSFKAPKPNYPSYLIVHHLGGTDANPLADTSNHTFEGVNEYHRIRFNFKSSMGYYIGYHYFIDKQGWVKQGRSDTEEGAHTIGKNSSSLGIVLAGNFDATEPTAAQIRSLSNLLQQKQKEYGIPLTNIVPHRHFAQKTCYGNKLSNEWAQQVLQTSLLMQINEALKKVADLWKKLFGKQK